MECRAPDGHNLSFLTEAQERAKPQRIIRMDAGQDTRACDVVIIGAGLSGLYAARTLVAAEVDVLVLEAQHRVGGRTRTTHLADGTYIDDGGQWVSPGQDRMVQLAAALGVTLFPSWGDGLTVDWHNGQRSTYHGLFPPGDPAAAPAARQAAALLTQMAGTVPLETPWTAPQATAWDQQTLHHWLAAIGLPWRPRWLHCRGGSPTPGPGDPGRAACRRARGLRAVFWPASRGAPGVP